MPKNKAFFLDRDGVIIKNIPYLHKIEDIEFISGVNDAIKMINHNGYKCIIVTNQSGVARGILTINKVNEINEFIKNYLEINGAKIDEFYICPHYPDGVIKKYSIVCDCRKPKPGMLKEAAKKYDIELLNSYMIGDKKSDKEAGEEVGCKSFQLKTNEHSFKELIDITKHFLD